MFSISSIISIPFFGEPLRIVRIKGLSPRLRKCPNPRNIRYRFSDIGYPISTYKDSPPQPCNSQESTNRWGNRPLSALISNLTLPQNFAQELFENRMVEQ